MSRPAPLLLMLVGLVAMPGSAAAQEESAPPEPAAPYETIPEAQPDPDPRDTFSLRLGFLHSALFGSNQGRPFFYLDFGLRYKTDQHYIDVRAPAFVAGLDFLSFQFQGLLGVQSPFNLFEAANDPIQYAAFLEPANVRLGQTYSTVFPGGEPLRLTGGIFMLVDFVFFQLALVNQDPEEFRDVNDPTATDPFVVAPGGFVAIGGDAPLSEWDFALGLGPDIYQDDNYVDANGFVIFGDLEVQIDPLDFMGAYIRTRVSTYTHAEKLVWTVVANYGVALSLL